MHPMERLRYLARAEGLPATGLAIEAALALADVAENNPVEVLPGSRRLLERHPAAGQLWWVCARTVVSDDPAGAAYQAATSLEEDGTARVTVDVLDEEATVLILGDSGIDASDLRHRGDLELLVTAASGIGHGLAALLREQGNRTQLVPDIGLGPAAAVVTHVLLPALGAGPGGITGAPGSRAAAAVANHAGGRVLAMTGVGTVLPGAIWVTMLDRLDGLGLEPWEREVEIVPAELLSAVCDSAGAHEVKSGLLVATCEPAPELVEF